MSDDIKTVRTTQYLCYYYSADEACTNECRWKLQDEKGNNYTTCDEHLPVVLRRVGLPARVDPFGTLPGTSPQESTDEAMQTNPWKKNRHKRLKKYSPCAFPAVRQRKVLSELEGPQKDDTKD